MDGEDEAPPCLALFIAGVKGQWKSGAPHKGVGHGEGRFTLKCWKCVAEAARARIYMERVKG